MSDRKFLHMIEQICSRRNISLDVLSDGWLLRLQENGVIRTVIGSSFDINTQAAAAVAHDKVATGALLEKFHVPHVRHVLLNPNAGHADTLALDGMLASGDVVMKPLVGGKGILVNRIDSADRLADIMRSNPSITWAICPWVDIEKEIRIVVLEDWVHLAYLKSDPVVVNGLKLFNLSQGAKAVSMDVADVAIEHTELAVRSVQALGLRFAAVDIVISTDGQALVLEVNASFSLMHYAAMNDATFEEVASLYDHVLNDMFAS